MPRVVVTPKFGGESRITVLDFSPYLPAGVTISSQLSTVAVWSGVDPVPTLVLTLTNATPLIKVKEVGGVIGVIYSVSINATLSDAEVIVLSYYLAILPVVY